MQVLPESGSVGGVSECPRAQFRAALLPLSAASAPGPAPAWHCCPGSPVCHCRSHETKDVPRQPKAKEQQEEEEAWSFGCKKVGADQGVPGTGARGEKHPAEDLDGLLELGKAGEKDEGPAKRVANIPPLGKSRQFLEKANKHGRRREEGPAREDGEMGAHVEAGAGNLQEESG